MSVTTGTVIRGTHARQLNLRTVLQAIADATSTSRAEVARATGLTPPTVSSLVADLIDGGLVHETGVGVSAGGKPPTLLGLDPAGRDLVAIDLSRQPFRGALVGLDAQVHRRLEAPRAATGDAAVREVRQLVTELAASSRAPVAGIGIGTPGLVDHDGTVREATNLDWHHMPLGDALRTDAPAPVWIANDADTAALAEQRHLPPDEDSIAVVKVGTGIGVGTLLSGDPYLGARAAAGEIGHLRVVDEGARCSCGNHGCLETVASVPSILAHAAARAGLPSDEVTSLDEVDARAAETAIALAARHLGSVLAHLVALLDVVHLVVTTDLGAGEQLLVDAVAAELQSRLLPAITAEVTVRPSAFGDDLVLAGAATLAARESLGLVWS